MSICPGLVPRAAECGLRSVHFDGRAISRVGLGQTRGDEKRLLPGLGARQKTSNVHMSQPARLLGRLVAWRKDMGMAPGVKFWRFCDSHVLASARVRPFLATAPAPTQPLRPGLPYVSPPRPCGSLSCGNPSKILPVSPTPVSRFPAPKWPSDHQDWWF